MTDRHGPRGTEMDERSVPDLVLERHRLGELPSAEQDEFTRRIDAEPELRHRLAALEHSDGELRRRFETGQLAARVRARLATRREHDGTPARGWTRAWPLPAGLAVAATLAFAIVLRTSVPPPPAADT